MDAQTRSALKKDDVFIHSTQVGLDWIAENRSKALRMAIAALVVMSPCEGSRGGPIAMRALISSLRTIDDGSA